MPLDPSKWVWCGEPGHMIASNNCIFHLCTRVGDYRISTIGDYRPMKIVGTGITARVEGREETAQPLGIGPDTLYETYVFRVAGKGFHGEGKVTDWSEIEGVRCGDGVEAERQHMRFVRKYAKKG